MYPNFGVLLLLDTTKASGNTIYFTNFCKYKNFEMWYVKIFRLYFVENRLTDGRVYDRCGGLTEAGLLINVVV